MKRIRVGIRGVTGTFAWSLLEHIRRSPDMEATVGIARDDPSLRKILESIPSLGSQKERVIGLFPERMIIEDERGAGMRRRVRDLNNAQETFEFMPSCDFTGEDIDILVDLTRGAKRLCEAQYPGIAAKLPILVVLDTGKEETMRGRLVSPPFVDDGEGNIWRLGDCVVSTISAMLSGLNNKLMELIPTVFCILDSKMITPVLPPAAISSLHFNSWPAPLVRKCMARDLGEIFESSEIGLPSIIQTPGLNHYALVLRLKLSEEMKKDQILELISQSQHTFIAPEGMTSTFQLEQSIERRLVLSGAVFPPIVIFSDGIEVERKDVLIQAAVRYTDIGPLMCMDAIRSIVR